VRLRVEFAIELTNLAFLIILNKIVNKFRGIDK
jgi:hypothetical protein